MIFLRTQLDHPSPMNYNVRKAVGNHPQFYRWYCRNQIHNRPVSYNGVPQNEILIMENPIEIDDLGYPHFRKPLYIVFECF